MIFLSAFSLPADNPKREFRGAWLHVIGQSQWQNMTPQKCREYIDSQLDRLLDAGCNAVIFQVRPTADAMYKSELEPWSTWLTGKRGRAPQEDWDPLAYAVEQAHLRGMELHAWLNPYRVTSSPKEILPSDHKANTEPHRFVKYDGKIFFDPAYQENRDFICKVVDDIVSRYDVDGIHIDDYFYPYPAGTPFNADKKSYEQFGGGMPLADWRRHNVDLLIEQLYRTIKDRKPWVRFGVSPFGIWRNKRNDARGSDTSGLQNYDDLYADVLLWDQRGWVDYVVPQLYWELDHKAASSRKLVRWWNDNIRNAQLYIGQDVKRTMDKPDIATGDKSELATKVELTRSLPNVKGNVWWHGYWVTDNYRGAADSLAAEHQSTLALAPAYGDNRIIPQKVKGLKISKETDGTFLVWDKPSQKEPAETDIVKYVVYEIFDGEPKGVTDPQTIVAITPSRKVRVYPQSGSRVTYLVTAVDRMNRESYPMEVEVNL